MKTDIQIKVRNYHLDRFGHVNNARYLEFLEEGRWSYSEENRLLEVFEAQKITHAAVNINIDYKKSARDGDLLCIETRVGRKGGKSITFFQKITLHDTGQTVSEAAVTNVYLDRQGKIIRVRELANFWEDLGHPEESTG